MPRQAKEFRNLLLSVRFADPRNGWAVGQGGTMLRSSPAIYPPLIEDTKVTSNGLGELDISFRVKPDNGLSTRVGADRASRMESAWHCDQIPQRRRRMAAMAPDVEGRDDRASYAGYFAGVLLLAPARLAVIGGAPALDSVVKPSGNVAFFWDLARTAFEGVALPWLCRHPRVGRAWTPLYRDGNDAWVVRAAPKVERALN
jgi:hypothetical protein